MELNFPGPPVRSSCSVPFKVCVEPVIMLLSCDLPASVIAPFIRQHAPRGENWGLVLLTALCLTQSDAWHWVAALYIVSSEWKKRSLQRLFHIFLLFFLPAFPFFFCDTCLGIWVCGGVYSCHCAHLEGRGQLMGRRSHQRVLRSDSGQPACWQVPLSTEPSCQPVCVFSVTGIVRIGIQAWYFQRAVLMQTVNTWYFYKNIFSSCL